MAKTLHSQYRGPGGGTISQDCAATRRSCMSQLRPGGAKSINKISTAEMP